MTKESFSNTRRSLLLAGGSALLLPKLSFAASKYGIAGKNAPELKVSECNTATSHHISS